MSNGVELDVGALMETSPALREAFDNLQAAAAQVTWCDCPYNEQVPSYWENDDGSHGWDCATCGNLLQTG